MSKLSPLALGILLGLAFPLSAQVYQSTDEDGNVSFSDQPSSGSKAVDIPETNVGDSVDVPPPAPEPEAPPEPEVVEQKAPEGELVEAAQQAILQHTGITTALETTGGTSDGRFIAPTGAQVLELGPVNESIHKLDEHVDVSELDQLSLIYQGILENLLT